MKRTATIMLLMIAAASVNAQDFITKKDGTDIKSKVLEVTQTEIKYKRFESPEGAIYTMPKSDVLIIRYQDGTKDLIGNSPERTPVPVSRAMGTTLTLQNNTREDIDVSYVYFDKVQSIWISKGWINIPAYSNNVIDLGDYNATTAYVCGQHNSKHWGQGAKFCVEDNDIRFSILHADRNDCWKSKRFDEVKLTGKNTFWLFE